MMAQEYSRPCVLHADCQVLLIEVSPSLSVAPGVDCAMFVPNSEIDRVSDEQPGKRAMLLSGKSNRAIPPRELVGS